MRSIVFQGDDFGDGQWLRRSSLNASEASRNERWLQELLFHKPELVPLETILSGTGGYVPICRELGIPKVGGTVFLDIFGVTAEGRLVLVECKLWRNPQARREVIAQILEYASLLRQWSYSDLTARLKASQGWTGANPLYDHVRKAFPDLEEAAFVDNVSRSMRIGDFALIIAGDGIREDVHAIAAQLNQNSGLVSRLALIEFQLWETEDNRTVVVPTVPLRTEVIQQRIVVTAEGNPVTLEEDISATDDAEAMVDPKANAAREQKRRFWQGFIDTVTFDHPDQPKPRHGGPGWVKFQMPGPTNHMVAYRTNGGEAGLFFVLKGEDGAAAYQAVSEAQESLEQQIGNALKLNEESSADTFAGRVTLLYPAQAEEDNALCDWLCKASNVMVNAFRPILAQYE